MNNIVIFTKKGLSNEKRIKKNKKWDNNFYLKNNKLIKDIYCWFLIFIKKIIFYKIVSDYYMWYKWFGSMNQMHCLVCLFV